MFQASRGLQFLSMTALEMADESLGERQLFARIAQRTYEFLGVGVVGVSSFVRERRAFRLEALAGAGEALSQALRALGRDPMGMVLPVDDQVPWSDLASPVLNRVAGGLYELCFGHLAAESCRRVEDSLGVRDAWSMGLGQGSRLFGSLFFLLPAGMPPPEPRVLETFVLIASGALVRRRAQDERLAAVRDLQRGSLAREDEGGDLTARIMDNSPVGILVLDRNGRIEFANRRAQTCLGSLIGQMKAGETGGAGPVLTDHEGRPLGREDLPSHRVLATGKAVNGARIAFHHPDGRCLFAIIGAAPLPGPSGDVDRVIETVEDVSADVHARRHQRASHEQFQRIVDDQVELICRFLPDGTLTFANPAFCEALGTTRDGLLSERGLDRVHPDDRQRLRRHLRGLSARRPSGTLEHRLVGTEGEVRWLQWTNRATFDDAGRAVEFQSVGRDVTERRATEERLAWLATHDAVTGLPNRVLLNDRLASVMARSARSEHLFALVLLDLDRFKEVNDTLGHAAGDGLLRAVGERLRGLLRRSDTVARLGGDEFTLLIPDLKDVNAVENFAAKVLRAFEAPFEVEGRPTSVTASVGVTVGLGLAVDGDTLMRQADRAMYQAKRAGRNAVRMFEDDGSTPASAAD